MQIFFWRVSQEKPVCDFQDVKNLLLLLFSRYQGCREMEASVPDPTAVKEAWSVVVVFLFLF